MNALVAVLNGLHTFAVQAYYLPASGVALVSFIFSPNWLSAAFAALVYIAELGGESLIAILQSVKRLRDVTIYIDEVISKGFLLRIFNVSDYFDSDELHSINTTRLMPLANISQICRIFVLRPQGDVVAPQRKGFVIPFFIEHFGGFWYGLRSGSLIFIHELPQNYTVLTKFYILHEIGHTTKYAFWTRARPWLALKCIVAVLLITSLATNNILWTILFALPYLCYRLLELIIFAVPGSVKVADELVADCFAIRNLPTEHLKRLQLMLHRLRQNKHLEFVQDILQRKLQGNVFHERDLVFNHGFVRLPFALLASAGGFFLAPASTNLVFNAFILASLLLLIEYIWVHLGKRELQGLDNRLAVFKEEQW
jgi:hypothetical protein